MALGCGLLVGLERERRKGDGDDRAAAGVRSFTVATLAGALAHAIGPAALGVGRPGRVAGRGNVRVSSSLPLASK